MFSEVDAKIDKYYTERYLTPSHLMMYWLGNVFEKHPPRMRKCFGGYFVPNYELKSDKQFGLALCFKVLTKKFKIVIVEDKEE